MTFKTAILYLLLLPRLLCAMSNQEFCDWWHQYRTTPTIPQELKAMEDHFVDSGLIAYSSNFWNYLNQMNIQQIVSSGFENFKQTVTRNYFTWVVTSDHLYAASIYNLVPHLTVTLPNSEMHRVHTLFTPEESLQFNRMTQALLNYMLTQGAAPLLERLEEPLIGNPPSLLYNGRRISQDIFNSLLEYMPISRYCPLDQVSTILEVGAGSGRTAFCFLSLHPGVKYVIVDLPPALYISQKYLSAVFPNKKVMTFRPFENFEDIAAEYQAADIVFLMPDQLPMLPNSSVDLFLAIDCLHEMKPERVAYYLGEAGRLSSHFYFKCWQETVVPFDNVSHTAGSYPIPLHWKPLFNEPCVVPSTFFHALYQTR